MYLKRLEIQGFKSLADKIELQFNPGVTGVVGPNGSGKSNISDAIRWVLGEQSAKTLRGAKMEDIIFSGSASRRPVGMAEVSLTLDNSSGRFPLDYSEVTVTRRVFRSGESEYIINKSPCRLRDIHELFMDTGIGREGYSIIGQGKIDEILNAKSEDRRQLIEEAAGIVKYKNRKIQAAKKLADTEQNLLRISDIIGELSAQVGPLEEQAATAEEYLNYKDELNKLEINLFVHQLEEVGDKLTEINTDLNEKKQAAVTVETDLRIAEAKAEELKLKVSKLDEEIAGVQQAVFELSSAAEKNEAAVKVAEERKRSLGRDRDRLTAELADIQRRIDNVKDQYAGEEEALAKLRQDISAVREELAVQESGLAEVDAHLAEGETGIETGKGDIFEILHETAAVRNELSNL
ncbi:MAG: chromosome segregation SMC family protein, partial [Bacillota bacterium]